MNNKIKTLIVVAILAIIGVVTGVTININIENGKTNASITYSEDGKPATITIGEDEIDGVETGQGAVGEEVKLESVMGEEIPTVEAVESNSPVMEVKEVECPDGEECGRGAVYTQVDISSPQAFANATLGKCIDVDGYYGAQCWDLMADFWYNYTGRTLTTCGTGAAKGAIADGCWQQNAGSEFIMVWNPADVQDGDIAFYSTGTWGHTGMVMGAYNSGYFTLLGQNQGGKSCDGGGSAANIINLSTRDFIGAFRPVIYIKPEPEPEPEPTPEPEPVVDVCRVRNVVKGDTLGAIMQECLGEIKWGESMNEYARSWVSKTTGLTVYYGWTHGSGYGLLAGDTIERK